MDGSEQQGATAKNSCIGKLGPGLNTGAADDGPSGIAAGIAATGQAVTLIVGGPAHWYAAGAGALSLALQVMLPDRRYVRVLKWLTLALLAYVATALTLKLPWLRLLHEALLPKLSWKPLYITAVVAVFGTTISPYLFFWQAAQEVEEVC